MNDSMSVLNKINNVKEEFKDNLYKMKEENLNLKSNNDELRLNLKEYQSK